MQTKGGGKHGILPAAEAGSDRALLPVNDAPRTRCGHVPRFLDFPTGAAIHPRARETGSEARSSRQSARPS